MHQIMFCLLRMDDNGKLPSNEDQLLGKDGQIYPDSLNMESGHSGMNGNFAFKDLLEQPAPRLFTTHSRADQLPSTLHQKGRLVVVARNPKDAFVSMFFFMEKLSKSWFPEYKEVTAEGMEKSFERYHQLIPSVDAPRGSSDYYIYYKMMVAFLRKIGLDGVGQTSSFPPRGFITFYEELHENFHDEVHRLAAFLGVSLTPKKFAALAERVNFGSMSGTAEGAKMHFKKAHVTTRKGVVGDYSNHLTEQHWARVDALFQEQLGEIDEFKPIFSIMKANKPRL